MVPLDLANVAPHTAAMSILAIIGLILVVLGVVILAGAVGGGTVLGLVTLLVGIALLAVGSGRLNL